MELTIKGRKITVRHTLRTMVYWEDLTGGDFALSSSRDILKYMYVCASAYSDMQGITFDDLLDGITPKDIESFAKEIQGGAETKKKKKPQSHFARAKCLLFSLLRRG